ncbi:DUF4365 domain-containing protein [Hymenobacter aquaticus]|uniref:DUF4365 domain-containing protein n=1 Tax=Hymenobacter aquaticus TaxID=1867101 RepID=A0A4Z0Q9H3_9BACT|nr:DUF4365 domain-containing protein [Hymenobacter aquaticus]
MTFYFSERHFIYWNAISENLPLFIVLHDPVQDIVYWQYYNIENIVKTSKKWKIDFPLNNILNTICKK